MTRLHSVRVTFDCTLSVKHVWVVGSLASSLQTQDGFQFIWEITVVSFPAQGINVLTVLTFDSGCEFLCFEYTIFLLLSTTMSLFCEIDARDWDVLLLFLTCLSVKFL